MKSALLKAYEMALYKVLIDKKLIVLKVGDSSSDLESIFQKKGRSTGIFLTAFNPGSDCLPYQENIERNQRLKKLVEEKGFHYLEGYSTDQKENWPKEESLLILGIPRAEADRLAKKFQQNAYLWLESNSVVKLRDLTLEI